MGDSLGGSSGAGHSWRMSARGQLLLGVITQILAISCWFNAAAVIPNIAEQYALSAAQSGVLTAGVQCGFAAGALILGVLRTIDRVRPGILIFWGSTATAVFTLVPAVVDGGFILFALSRVFVGFGLALVYPTGMRAVLSWAPARLRAPAVAVLVMALTYGTAGPHLLAGSAPEDWRSVMVSTAALAGAAALLGLLARTGPHVSPVQQVSLAGLATLIRDRVQRRISVAYIGHMWEVYGMWLWLPSLLGLLPAFRLIDTGSQATVVGVWTFVIIGVAGMAGCAIGGMLPSRLGNRPTARWIVGVSGLCVLATPFMAAVPTWLALTILMMWGASTIGDSALYSTMTGDESGNGAVGTAIVMQMATGYSVSVLAIYAVPLFADMVGWQYAFLILALGPLVSFVALRPWASDVSIVARAADVGAVPASRLVDE